MGVNAKRSESMKDLVLLQTKDGREYLTVQEAQKLRDQISSAIADILAPMRLSDAAVKAVDAEVNRIAKKAKPKLTNKPKRK